MDGVCQTHQVDSRQWRPARQPLTAKGNGSLEAQYLETMGGKRPEAGGMGPEDLQGVLPYLPGRAEQGSRCPQLSVLVVLVDASLRHSL